MNAATPTRRRIKTPPIWAQRAKNTTPLKKWNTHQEPAASNGTFATAPPPPSKQRNSSNAQSDSASSNLWEPSFTNVIPYEEVTRSICDFLFHHVVSNEGIGVGSAGGVPSPNGQLEIEAKIGRLVDKSGDRIQLPIKTEAVLEETLDVTFESMMTVEQHEKCNKFLNDAVAQSMTPGSKPRIAMQYKHTHETDTFYELPKSEISQLPPSIQQQLLVGGGNSRPKLRITRDQKTGRIIAKILKTRIKDMQVYSPRTNFDWRISVNLEMNWEGDVDALVANSGEQKRASDRNKDRMSYSHLCYQIDLTQVKPGVGGQRISGPAIHELEVEVASSEVRRQGKLALEGKSNRYEDIIKAFADNVRILARSI